MSTSVSELSLHNSRLAKLLNCDISLPVKLLDSFLNVTCLNATLGYSAHHPDLLIC